MTFAAAQAVEHNDLTAVLAVRELPQNGGRVVRLLLPLKMQTKFGTRLLFDGNKPVEGPFVRCRTTGCVADYSASPDVAARLVAGGVLTAQAINVDGKPLNFKFALTDYGETQRGKPSSWAAIPKQRQQQLQDLVVSSGPEQAIRPAKTAVAYIPWIKSCRQDADPSPHRTCFTGMDVRDRAGEPLAAAVLIEPSINGEPALRITLPLNVGLRSGVKLAFDGVAYGNAPFVICLPNGCMADFGATAALLGKLTTSRSMELQASPSDGFTSSVQLPLDTFAGVHDRPALEPPAAQRLQQKLRAEAIATLANAQAKGARGELIVAAVPFAPPAPGPAVASAPTPASPPAPSRDEALVRAAHQRGEALQQQAKLGEAGQQFRIAIEAAERAWGSNSPKLAPELSGLATVLRRAGQHAEAETLLLRALALPGLGDADLGGVHSDLVAVYYRQERKVEAMDHALKALALLERTLDPNSKQLASAIADVGTLLSRNSRIAEAVTMLERALAIYEKNPENSTRFAQVLVNLANNYEYSGRRDDARKLLERTVAMLEKNPSLQARDQLSSSIGTLGDMSERDKRYDDAADQYKKVLAIREETFGATHPQLVLPLRTLGRVEGIQNRYEPAKAYYDRALAIELATFGEGHPDVALILNALAQLENKRGDARASLDYYRRATSAVLARSKTAVPGALTATGQANDLGTYYFRRHVAALSQSGDDGGDAAARQAEAFEIAQRANESSAGAAVQLMGARARVGDPALAALIRRRQDLAAAREQKASKLISLATTAQTADEKAALEVLRQEKDATERELAGIADKINRGFPAYAQLANPEPLNYRDVQQLLGADEAFVFWLVGADRVDIFALTRDQFVWKTTEITSKQLEDKITTFRTGLDIAAVRDSVLDGHARLFDLAVAHDLYRLLLDPVAPLLQGKRQLLAVPDRALTALPLHLLVSAPPPIATPELKDVTTYRDAHWLVKDYAVTVLPSVRSLEILGGAPPSSAQRKPLIGFADPVFDPAERARAIADQQAAAKLAKVSRAYSEFWQGAGIDRDRLAQSLPTLLDTAAEVRAVARSVGARDSDIMTGAEATETNVKQKPLADYRIIYFATHGLVAGDIKGIGEPALALSLPAKPSETDDGLLTASEVAQLKLDADWVVLSACNTVAGGKPGAEALSGLARAFFYAGARALLVSHWSVESAAATRLSTSTFKTLQADGRIGRSEALRRAMLDYMADTSDPLNAYPGMWGPFAIIGDGRALQPAARR
ncbi:CHAT domain-containing protein [Bradyrhizobium ontarionense]|uniref:CHAT domain-containing protein n=1 Tax=Bradyrhizobium ontarionense TaxID=2898149 RepID=A0ABY3R3U1_9BRAD|nr:CHAT domain-containing protein [Bradyrhizobium sp. A19]UFZ01974.1 CHAT domain-containing protein [Bradyrhizobium sp. A19]